MPAPNYLRSSEIVREACPKPVKGSRVLAREEDRAAALKLERQEKGAAKKRDTRCRWPEKHTCRGPLEAAHIRDASLLGPMHRTNLVALCMWLHRSGPESVHGKQLLIERETSNGAQGPLSFWRKGEDGEFYLVRREVRPFEYEKD
jgi:hypothetical protein